MLFAGGGTRTGQVIGAADIRGEDPIERSVGPQFLRTTYQHLNIPAANIAIRDLSGQPTPFLRDDRPIPKLTRSV